MAEIPTSRDILDKFKGYNHNLRIGDGEFYDMKNLTGDYYPVLSPRKKRGIYLTPNKPNGMCSNTRFCYVDGSNLILRDDNGNEETYDMALTGEQKDLISIGANIVIMPDQKYINTVSPADRGSLLKGVYDVPTKKANSTDIPKVVITLVCRTPNGFKTVISKAKGNKIILLPYASRNIAAYTMSEIVANGYDESTCLVRDREDMWMCASDRDINGSLSSYQLRIPTSSSATSPNYSYFQWDSNADGTFKKGTKYNVAPLIGIFTLDDDEEYLGMVFDKLTPGKFSVSGTGVDIIDKSNSWNSSYFPNITPIVDAETSEEEVERKGILLPGSLYTDIWEQLFGLNQTSSVKCSPTILATPIQITNKLEAGESPMPKTDYVVESSNRLWGCRYGTNNNGDFVNEIYASKLGDFKDWVPLEDATVATSAYSVPVGTSGAFTGAINYGGKPIFFKEDCMHRVFGDFPSNYQVQTIMCKGVQEGCSKSLAIVNDILYYKSRSGICAFDGSLPVEISMQFGDKQYKNAVAGAIGDKYYVSMQDESGKWHMFAYDTIKRLWHREDDTQATQFCNHKGELYYIDYADNNIHTVKGTGVIETDPIPWSAETGILGANTPDNKYVSRLDLRMSIARGSELAVYIEYDSMGDWEKIADIEGLTLNTFTIPVQPRRCDHFRLKFVGEGEAKIFSISKVLEESE